MVIPFLTTRADGRSDREVVYDLIKDAEPDAVFTHVELITALQTGVETEITRDREGGAVRAANKLFLERDQRVLVPIRSVGYVVARADDHVVLAQQRHRRARREEQQGLALVSNVRYGELSPELRPLVRDLQLVYGQFLQLLLAGERRTQRLEHVVEALSDGQAALSADQQSLAERVARLEEKP